MVLSETGLIESRVINPPVIKLFGIINPELPEAILIFIP